MIGGPPVEHEVIEPRDHHFFLDACRFEARQTIVFLSRVRGRRRKAVLIQASERLGNYSHAIEFGKRGIARHARAAKNLVQP